MLAQVQAGELEQVVSGASEGSGGQLARTSSHYMGPVASDSLAHTWMHHAWADAGHVLNRCPMLVLASHVPTAHGRGAAGCLRNGAGLPHT